MCPRRKRQAADLPDLGPLPHSAQNIPGAGGENAELIPVPDGIRVEVRDLEEFHPQRDNARVHSARNLAMIEDSLHEIGAMRSLSADEHDEIFAGSGTWESAINAGFRKAVVVETAGDAIIIHRRVGLTPGQKARYAIEDNASTDQSRFDDGKLAEFARTNPELLAGIFNDGEIAEWARLEESARAGVRGGGNEYDATPAPVGSPTKCAPGDVWEVGEGHLLKVGDCRNPDDVADLFRDGRAARSVATSPPYAEQRSEDYPSVPAREYVTWWEPVQALIRRVLEPKGSLFVNIKEHSEDFERDTYVAELVIAMKRRWEWRWIDTFCWERAGMPGDPHLMGKFKNGWEPIYWWAPELGMKFRPTSVMHATDDAILDRNFEGTLATTQGSGRSAVGARKIGAGRAYPNNRLRFGNNDAALGHSAAFPVELPDYFYRFSSDLGDVVYDPFAGSGSSLIAAARLRRHWRGMEVVARWADVTINRAIAEGLSPVQRLAP